MSHRHYMNQRKKTHNVKKKQSMKKKILLMILNNFKGKTPQDINGINTYLQYISP